MQLAAVLERHELLICSTTALASVKADYDPTEGGLTINGKEVNPLLGMVMTYPFNSMSRCPGNEHAVGARFKRGTPGDPAGRADLR